MLLTESHPRPQISWTLSSFPGEAARSLPSGGTVLNMDASCPLPGRHKVTPGNLELSTAGKAATGSPLEAGPGAPHLHVQESET